VTGKRTKTLLPIPRAKGMIDKLFVTINESQHAEQTERRAVQRSINFSALSTSESIDKFQLVEILLFKFAELLREQDKMKAADFYIKNTKDFQEV
jgi:hypothetical protein